MSPRVAGDLGRQAASAGRSRTIAAVLLTGLIAFTVVAGILMYTAFNSPATEDRYDDGYAAGFLAGNASGWQYGYGNGSTYGVSYGYDWGYGDGNSSGFGLGNLSGYSQGLYEGNASGWLAGNNSGWIAGNDSGWITGNGTGYAEGYAAGYSAGYSNGYSAGYSVGYSIGYGIGYSNGYDAGYADGTYYANLIGINLNFTNKNNIIDRYNVTFSDPWTKSNSTVNSTWYFCAAGQPLVIPLAIPDNESWSNISLFLNSSGNVFNWYIVDAHVVYNISSNGVSFFQDKAALSGSFSVSSPDLYLIQDLSGGFTENGTYYLVFYYDGSGGYVCESDQTGFYLEAYDNYLSDKGFSVAYNIGAMNYTREFNQSMQLDVGSYNFGFLCVKIMENDGYNYLVVNVHMEVTFDVGDHAIMGTWDNFTLSSNTSFFLSSISLTLYENSSGSYDFSSSDLFNQLVRHDFAPNTNSTIEILHGDLLYFPDSTGWTQFLEIALKVDEEVFDLSTRWILSE